MEFKNRGIEVLLALAISHLGSNGKTVERCIKVIFIVVELFGRSI